MSETEKNQIEADGYIKCSSQSWHPYAPKSVVFLLDMENTSDEFLHKVADLNREMYGPTWILDFEADLDVELDKSQTGWPGAVVAKGDIAIAATRSLSWKFHE
jgi:hypothetical protein